MTVEIVVYSDGSGNTFDSDGGWGCRLLVDGVHHQDGSGYLEKATNNTAELTAAIRGLEGAKRYLNINAITDYKVTLISDSQLVLGYASGKYKCKAEHLKPLYNLIRILHDELSVTTKWERGHIGEVNNEAVDKLAGQARANKKGISDVL